MTVEEVQQMLIELDFSPELVNVSKAVHQRGGNPTVREQEQLDQLKADILACLNTRKQRHLEE